MTRLNKETSNFYHVLKSGVQVGSCQERQELYHIIYMILGIQPNKDLSNLSVTRNGQTNFYIHLIKNKEGVS